MERKIVSVVLLSVLAVVVSGVMISCATPGEEEAVKEAQPIPGGPYVFELGGIEKADFETAPYLPEKIRFELEKRLRLKGLLAEPSSEEKRLIVEVEVRASYSGLTRSHSCSDCYHDLSSHVWVKKAETGGVLGETVIRSFNGSTGVVSVSDFTELSHAKDIAAFLERLVK